MPSRKDFRIAIIGFGIESSAYAAHRADYRDFPVLTGDELLTRYPFLAPGQPLSESAEWLPIFHAGAIPGGQVRPEVYHDFRQRIVDGLRKALQDGPIDGVYASIHGAMSVVGMDDAEGDLISAVRDVVGPDAVIAAPMDLHGNVSSVLAREVELLTCYRMAPHEDVPETRERAATHLVERLRLGRTPARAWVRVPILLPGEKTSTRVEPAKSLYARVPEVEAHDGVLDASIWIGYAWADEPRCHATVIVSGDDEATIAADARDLATAFWGVRDDFEFVGPPGTLDQAITAAIDHHRAGEPGPYLISDSGDNPGAGGTGDVTWTLSEVLRDGRLSEPSGPLTYIASVFDAPAIEELFAHRPGDDVDVMVGARVDHQVSGPARVRGRLVSLHEGDPAAGRQAVIAVNGLRVIVTEFRKAFHETWDFAGIGLDPQAADIIITKIGYLEPTLYDIAQGWTLALTPGPVDQDLERLGHSRIQRPMFPFDQFDADPDLTPTVLPGRTLSR